MRADNLSITEGAPIDVPRGDLVRLIDAAVFKFAARPAIDFLDREISYAELGRLIDKAAKGLQARGVVPGTRIGLSMPNSPYYPILFFAGLKAGAEMVNFSPAYKRDELRDRIKDSGVKFMVSTDAKESYENLAGLLGEFDFTLIRCPLVDMAPRKKSIPFHALDALPGPLKKLLVKYLPKKLADYIHQKAITAPAPSRKDKRIVNFGALTHNDGKFKPVPHKPEDTALLQYTGGTTGVAKAAMLTHFNLVAQARQIDAFAFPGPKRFDQEIFIAAAPYFHVLGMMTAMLFPLSRGDKLVIIPDPRNQRDVLDKIHRKRPTVLPAVPRQLQALAEYPEAKETNFSSLRFAIAGGSALAPNVREAFEKLAGKPGMIKQGYGLSECSPVLTCNPPQGLNKPDSVGVALPDTEVRIVDPEDHSKILPLGQNGEIQGRGPQVMKEYFNRPEDTAKALDADGWFSTGDGGRLDRDGYLFIGDRLKDMIKINGEQTSSIEIEKVVSLHPAVAECAVIAVKDARSGEAAKAFVRFLPGAKDIPTPEELQQFLRGKAQSVNIPKYIVVMTEEIPKTAVGKPDKKLLRQWETQKTPPPISPSAPPAPPAP